MLDSPSPVLDAPYSAFPVSGSDGAALWRFEELDAVSDLRVVLDDGSVFDGSLPAWERLVRGRFFDDGSSDGFPGDGFPGRCLLGHAGLWHPVRTVRVVALSNPTCPPPVLVAARYAPSWLVPSWLSDRAAWNQVNTSRSNVSVSPRLLERFGAARVGEWVGFAGVAPVDEVGTALAAGVDPVFYATARLHSSGRVDDHDGALLLWSTVVGFGSDWRDVAEWLFTSRSSRFDLFELATAFHSPFVRSSLPRFVDADVVGVCGLLCAAGVDVTADTLSLCAAARARGFRPDYIRRVVAADPDGWHVRLRLR